MRGGAGAGAKVAAAAALVVLCSRAFGGVSAGLTGEFRGGEGEVSMYGVAQGEKCPCTDRSLCNPVGGHSRVADRELFGFSVNSTNWHTYNWTLLTTVATFGMQAFDPEMVCTAHSYGVRVVLTGFWSDTDTLADPEARKEWIGTMMENVTAYGMDGINLDFENFIPADDKTARDGLSELIEETSAAVHAAGPGMQFSVDVAWSPIGIDERFYDYRRIATVSDVLFVMAYDMRSQVFSGPCIASANSPYPLVEEALANWTRTDEGGPIAKGSQIVLGLPWYGYVYTCIDTKDPTAAICPIAHTEWRNATCSDAVGHEMAYADLLGLIPSATRPVTWNDTLASPFFNIVDGPNVTQIWFDNPKSLERKSLLTTKFNLLGTGMWNLESIFEPDPNMYRAMFAQ